MSSCSDRTTTPIRRRKVRRLVVGATLLWAAALPPAATAEDDVLQQAVNYVFTGTVEPENAPEIRDRTSCVVVVADPKWNRFIRYDLSRLGLDDPRIDSTYSGRQTNYQLDIEADQVVVEYLGPDRKTVINGYKSAQIPLPGEIDRTRKAIQWLAAHCKRNGAGKLPF